MGSYSPPQEGQIASQRPYSEATAELVDEEVRRLAQQAHDRTLALLTEKKELTRLLAEKLSEKEVILKEDVVSVLGERPFPDSDALSLEPTLTAICAARDLSGTHMVHR